jgi:hypothetical protein
VYQQPNGSFRPRSLLKRSHSKSNIGVSEAKERKTHEQMGRKKRERARKELIHMIHDTLQSIDIYEEI